MPPLPMTSPSPPQPPAPLPSPAQLPPSNNADEDICPTQDSNLNPTTEESQPQNAPSTLRKLYISHTLSTWNARTFEFSAVIFLATRFPSTLFYASTYALFRSLAAFLLSARIGQVVDARERLSVVRGTIVWARGAVAGTCVVLLTILKVRAGESEGGEYGEWMTLLGFAVCVVLACVEKLAFVGNTIAVERDWAVVVADALDMPREELNSGMRRIDLVCKLVAPVCISLVEGYSSRGAVWVVFGQNAASVGFVSFISFSFYGYACGLFEGGSVMLISWVGILCYCGCV